MPTLTLLTHILPLALLLAHISLAQQDAPQCSALSSALAYNASGTTTLPALSVSYLGDPDDGNIRIINVTDQQWQLSTFVQPYTPPGSSSPPDPQSNRTQTVLWLDTGRSDLTRLGRSMRMCHNYVPLQVAANVTWSHEVLRKSVADTGDCRALVSEACLDRLRGQYTAQAGAQRGSLYDRCRRTNNTLPWECGGNGMVEAVSAPNPEFNSTLPSRFAYLQSSGRDALNTTDPLVCDGRNLSSSTALLGPTQDYDLGVNFPIMDIMAFFGTADYGNVQRSDAYRVQIACLVPGQVTEGSKEKASVDSVLARYNSTGGDQTAGAQALALGRGLEVWMVVAWAFAVGFAFAV